MPQFGRKTRRSENEWSGKGSLRWDIGMMGEGCWTVPAYQDPSFLQTAGGKTLSEPHGIGITPIHPAWRSHTGQSHLRGEQDHPAPASLPESTSPPHHLPGWGAPGSRRCWHAKAPSATACALIAALRRREPALPARAGGIWVRLARHGDLLCTLWLWDMGVAQEDVGIDQEKL